MLLNELNKALQNFSLPEQNFVQYSYEVQVKTENKYKFEPLNNNLIQNDTIKSKNIQLTYALSIVSLSFMNLSGLNS